MDLKSVIAANIAELRRKQNLTQLDLAEKLNYTDKAVSKWERGESVPDIAVLKNIADLFGVTVDYLLEETHREPAHINYFDNKMHTRGIITGLAVLLVWMMATIAFVVVKLAVPSVAGIWLAFLVAVPVSFAVWLVFNTIWFRHTRNYLIISLLMWSLLATIHISLLTLGVREYMWLVYILGAPGQAIILLWSNVKKRWK